MGRYSRSYSPAASWSMIFLNSARVYMFGTFLIISDLRPSSSMSSSNSCRSDLASEGSSAVRVGKVLRQISLRGFEFVGFDVPNRFHSFPFIGRPWDPLEAWYESPLQFLSEERFTP
jgi:hypothetical protein